MTLAKKIKPTGFPDRVVANPKPSEDKIALIRAYLASTYHMEKFHSSRLGAAVYLNVSISEEEWAAARGRRHPKLQ